MGGIKELLPVIIISINEIERISNSDWREKAGSFKLDYVVLTPQEKQRIIPDRKLIPAVSIGNYQIYKYEK